MLFFLALFFFLAVSGSSGSQNPDQRRVAIIGAGIAGLSTANRFLDLGFDDFVVFEALDRPGGRIHGVPYRDGFLQMGAQFINGANNPLFDLAQRLGVVGEVVDDYVHVAEATYLAGECPIDANDVEVFREFTAPLDEYFHRVAFTDDDRSTLETVKSMYDVEYDYFLKKQNVTSGFRKHVFDALTRSYRSFFEFEYAARWDDLSLRAITEWDDLGKLGESFVTNRIGYTAIIDHLAGRIPDDNIRYNHRIAGIDYTGPRTRLTLFDGTEIKETFDLVIVTASLGHLKLFADKLFTPPLPPRKKAAIEKIGMGASAKVFLEYDEPFWHDAFISPLVVEECGGVDPVHAEFTTFQAVPWAPNVLMAWIAGRGPAKVDALNDSDLSASLTTLFRRATKNSSVSEPRAIYRTPFNADDLFGGSYSYVSHAQALAGVRHADLSIPVRRNGSIRVQFAGEATHHRVFQTAVGAFLSGRREADRALHAITDGA